MSESGTGLPLSLRKKDIFFVLCFSFFAFSSFFSDSWHALGLLEGDAFWSRANRWYGEIAQAGPWRSSTSVRCCMAAPSF